MGVLKGREAKQIGGNYATMVNILQYKKGLRVEAKKNKKGGSRYGRNEMLARRLSQCSLLWRAHVGTGRVALLRPLQERL